MFEVWSDRMKPFYQTDLGQLYHGNCLEVMAELEAGSVDIVTNFPLSALAGSGFKGA